MKFVPIASLALLILAASASADPGINLLVGDCAAGANPVNTIDELCNSNVGTAFGLIGSVILPAANKPQFSGCQSILDIQGVDNAPIPDWWRADGCRSSAFVPEVDPVVIGGSCPTLWDAVSPAGTTLTAVFADGAPAYRIRYLIETVLDGGVAATTTLTGDGVTERSVFRLTVTRARTTGTDPCAGCVFPACLVLQEINFRSLPDAPGDWLRLTAAATSRHVVFNGDLAGGVCPAGVPVRNRTWGSLKALYR